MFNDFFLAQVYKRKIGKPGKREEIRMMPIIELYKYFICQEQKNYEFYQNYVSSNLHLK